MKKIFSLLAVLMLLFALTVSMVSCGGEQTPPNDNEPPVTGDGSGDGDGDVEGGEKPDGGAPEETDVYFTITVLNDRDEPVSGIMVQMCEGETCIPKRTDDNGKAIFKVAKEDANLNYEAKLLNIPDGYDGDSESYYAFDEDRNVTLYIFKQPDGTAEYPYFVAEDHNEYTVAAGAPLNFQIRGSAERYVVFKGEGFEVKYGEETYTPADGQVKIMFLSESTFMPCSFTVTGKADADVALVIENEYIPGTSGAPIVIESLANAITATVTNGTTVYYDWVAVKTGVLVFSCDNIANNVTLYNTSSYLQTSPTDGASALYIDVTAGDVVSVMVSANFASSAAADATKEITFTLAEYLATADEPLPLTLANGYYRVKKNSSLVFSAAAGKTVTVEGSGASVTFDGQTLTADANGKITFTLSEGKTVFTVSNTTAENEEYEIKLA